VEKTGDAIAHFLLKAIDATFHSYVPDTSSQLCRDHNPILELNILTGIPPTNRDLRIVNPRPMYRVPRTYVSETFHDGGQATTPTQQPTLCFSKNALPLIPIHPFLFISFLSARLSPLSARPLALRGAAHGHLRGASLGRWPC
jgi:hypothetical protein